MWVRLLGPVSAETDGVPLRLGGRKQRAVFALLPCRSTLRWRWTGWSTNFGEMRRPAQATLSLQSYISRLRRTISDAQPEDQQAPQILIGNR